MSHSEVNNPCPVCAAREELLSAGDRVVDALLAMTDDELFAELEKIKPSDDYLEFMAALERGDHLKGDMSVYTTQPLTPIREDGSPV